MDVWKPEYAVKINDKNTLVHIDGIESEECPVSLLKRSPWGSSIRSLVTQISQAIRVKEMTGAWPGGPDSSRWSSRFYDAVEMAFIEQRRFDRAVDDACAVISRSPAGGMA